MDMYDSLEDYELGKKSDEPFYRDIYSRDLYFAHQNFVSNNRENIKKFVMNYFCSSSSLIEKYEEGLNEFYFGKGDKLFPKVDRPILTKNYKFENFVEYFSILNKLNFFEQNIKLKFDSIIKDFKNYKNEFIEKLNLNKLSDVELDNIHFNFGKVNKDGTVSLFNQNRLCEKIDLLTFLKGYEDGTFSPTDYEDPDMFESVINNMLIKNPPSYWEFLNESIYVRESLKTTCFMYPVYPDKVNVTYKKNKYIQSFNGNILCFKVLYNSIVSQKFRDFLAEKYVESYMVSANDVFKLTENQNEKDYDPVKIDESFLDSLPKKIKIKWVSDEILSFAKTSIKGPLGIELLLTPFMMYRFVYFSKQKIFINFNQYGIWEEFGKSKENNLLRLKIRNIVDIMMSVNLSDLDYYNISSKNIISNLIDRILTSPDFYKEEQNLEFFIQNAACNFINFKDFIFDLTKGIPYLKNNILQYENINNSVKEYNNFSYTNEQFICLDLLLNGLNFYRYIDIPFSKFNINNMGEYLLDHFKFDPKQEAKCEKNKHDSIRADIIASYDNCYQKFNKIYESLQEDVNVENIESTKENQNQSPIENSYSNESSLQLFLEQDLFDFFITDDTKVINNLISFVNVKNHLIDLEYIAKNSELLALYEKYCEINNLEIDRNILFNKDNTKKDKKHQSSIFNSIVINYFQEKKYYYDTEKESKNSNPNIIQENLINKIPIVFKGTLKNERCYFGFKLKPLEKKVSSDLSSNNSNNKETDSTEGNTI